MLQENSIREKGCILNENVKSSLFIAVQMCKTAGTEKNDLKGNF